MEDGFEDKLRRNVREELKIERALKAANRETGIKPIVMTKRTAKRNAEHLSSGLSNSEEGRGR